MAKAKQKQPLIRAAELKAAKQVLKTVVTPELLFALGYYYNQDDRCWTLEDKKIHIMSFHEPHWRDSHRTYTLHDLYRETWQGAASGTALELSKLVEKFDDNLQWPAK